MHKTLTTWCARVLLALISLGFAAAAQASTIYNFKFTDSFDSSHVVGAGSFTTGATASDPGYESITSLTFDQLTTNSGPVFGPMTATGLQAGVAYNPVTGEFINHSGGGTYHNLGQMFFVWSPYSVNLKSSFALDPALQLFGTYTSPGNPEVFFDWSVDLAVSSAPPSVPEPTSLVLLGTGLLGAVVSRRRPRTT